MSKVSNRVAELEFETRQFDSSDCSKKLLFAKSLRVALEPAGTQIMITVIINCVISLIYLTNSQWPFKTPFKYYIFLLIPRTSLVMLPWYITLGKHSFPPSENPQLCIFFKWIKGKVLSSPRDINQRLIHNKVSNETVWLEKQHELQTSADGNIRSNQCFTPNGFHAKTPDLKAKEAQGILGANLGLTWPLVATLQS